ncbi:LysR family transcriptional regulator [Poseidonocella sp. HB161398]|uniref:LysR family transcriptional regulator n=1 Tax=Poseidonocella sp. HB161398 TaxID=2320855 RepID=UPI001108C84A|nr:LysR family transcriptional regulator [Poseidonocella sp. HB161398]
MRRVDQLTLKQLRALEAVAREGAINRAAEVLNLTPPAVHNQLKQLEDLMGCTLVDRARGEGFELTAEGESLLAAYREGRSALERSIHHIDALAAGLAGSVVLGVVSTAKYFGPSIVARLKRDLPDVRVRLEVGNRAETLEALAERRFDLTIMGRPPRMPPVTAEPIGEHPHLIVAAPEHPLARATRIRPAELLDQTFILREPGSGTRILATRYLDEICEGREMEMLQMNSNETIKQAVISGLGIAMLSGHTVFEELRSGRLVALRCPGLPLKRQWYLVERQDQIPSRTAVKVRDWMLTHRETLLPRLELLPNNPGARDRA